LINKTQHDEIYYITSHFFCFLGFGQVKPLTPQDVPEEVKKLLIATLWF
jgi:hypothetical protein